MIARINTQQIAQNRINLERAARMKHNRRFDDVSLVVRLALWVVGGVK